MTTATGNGKPTNGHAATATNRVGKLLENPAKQNTRASVTITPPNMQTVKLKIRGTTPYVQHKIGSKLGKMMEAQSAGSTAKGKKKRDPKNFDAECAAATYQSKKREHGIPCAAFRAAMVSACKLVGFAMTRGKIAFFVLKDIDDVDGTQLVKITKGKPERFDAMVRNATGVADVRSRPRWSEGWEAMVAITFDADMFTVQDVTNLLARAGCQIGVGEGRPDSKESCGMGWGLFEVVN